MGFAQDSAWSVYLPVYAVRALVKHQVFGSEIVPGTGKSLPKYRAPARSLDNLAVLIHREAIHSSPDLYSGS